MYVDVRKVGENETEVIYEFFSDISISNGIFIVYKDKIDPIDYEHSFKLLKPIDVHSPNHHYQRAKWAVVKGLRKEGGLPEKSFFMSG